MMTPSVYAPLLLPLSPLLVSLLRLTAIKETVAGCLYFSHFVPTAGATPPPPATGQRSDHLSPY